MKNDPCYLWSHERQKYSVTPQILRVMRAFTLNERVAWLAQSAVLVTLISSDDALESNNSDSPLAISH